MFITYPVLIVTVDQSHGHFPANLGIYLVISFPLMLAASYVGNDFESMSEHFQWLLHTYVHAYTEFCKLVISDSKRKTFCLVYSELPLIRTPEMWPPLYSGHSEKSQSMLYSTNSPLK